MDIKGNFEPPPYKLVPQNRPTVCYRDDPNQPTVQNQPQKQNSDERHVVPSRPPDYTVAAVLACIFCSPYVGILAIFSAMQSKTMTNIGEYKEAKRHSRLAKRLVIASFAIGLFGLFVVCMYVVYIMTIFYRYANVNVAAIDEPQLASTPNSGY
ncbi:uncharacterized protein LOC127841582 [Dreissena polymorpha]|uniref:uncharacterized protein LOC127841582 n=1 Tax=Dreissena polymorpha TaxID=45954 RepID=UPI0022642FC0|nr:uncharacterized protein LOC127841582 [Dreissena polymorpha]